MRLLVFTLLACIPARGQAADYPQWGGSPSRNNVINDADAKKAPLMWDVGAFDESTGEWKKEKSKNIKWVARLGSNSYGNPTVAGGKVFVGTNNERGYLARFPAGKVDLGVLLCFNEADGKFLWQYSAEKLAAGDKQDYALAGICSSPLVKDGRVYFVDNRCEVVCLDANGFHDGKNDGVVRNEENATEREADVLWRYDMRRLGVTPVFMSASSVTAHGDFVYVHTGNAADEMGRKVPKPEAPSFIVLRDGFLDPFDNGPVDPGDRQLMWRSGEPAGNVLHGSWSSPALQLDPADKRAMPMVIFAGGDAWLYCFRGRHIENRGGFDRATGTIYDPAAAPASWAWSHHWKFDLNPKTSAWKSRGEGDRTSVIASPVIDNDRVYVATGQITEHANTPAALICLDLGKASRFGGDVSDELVFNPKHDGGKTPIAPKRELAADKDAGDIVKPNPKSSLAWRYTGDDLNKNGKLDADEIFHRSISNAAVKNGLVIAVDMTGIVHCVDATTGKAHWTHDMLAGSWSTPMIAGERIYICNEAGDVLVFALAKEKKLLATNDMKASIYSTPIMAGGVLYIMTKSRLFAITAP